MERLAGEGYSVQVEFWYGALDNVAWHCNLWEGHGLMSCARTKRQTS
jgi:hypothetical protein